VRERCWSRLTSFYISVSQVHRNLGNICLGQQQQLFFLPQRKYICQYRHSKAGRRRKDTSVIPSATTQSHVVKEPKRTRSLALR